MLINFTGKTAVVTGGAGGIGLVCAKTLLESGAKVAIVDLAPDKAATITGQTIVIDGGASVVGY